MNFPKLYQVRQAFDDQRITDIPAAVSEQIARLNLDSRCKPGQSVAITAGSRGITDIVQILASIVAELRNLGLHPFIIPAMGSHGGGKAEGQAKVLKKYGVTEETVGAPIRATMDVVEIGRTEDGIPVVVDRFAFEADWIVVVNRAKTHTRFSGDIESGMCKMMLIGLGKAAGALSYHRAEVHLSFDRVVQTAVPMVLEKAHILFGLGIVENGYDQTARIETAPPEGIIELDKDLQADSKRRMPRLPFKAFDLVVIDDLGKNFSGTGMDTNVVGWKSGVETTRVYARDLHPGSGGNAAGIGWADLVHRRLVDKTDVKATYLNCLTAIAFQAAKIPMTFDTDREALEAALDSIGLIPPEKARVCWIPNTLHLAEIWLSEALVREAESHPDLEIESGPHPIDFDESGDFVPCPRMFAGREGH